MDFEEREEEFTQEDLDFEEFCATCERAELESLNFELE